MVGISGNSGDRFALLMPSALMRPSFRCGSALATLSNSRSILPLIRSGIASAVPRYGMWTRNRPVCALKYSALRWTMVPLPLLA